MFVIVFTDEEETMADKEEKDFGSNIKFACQRQQKNKRILGCHGAVNNTCEQQCGAEEEIKKELGKSRARKTNKLFNDQPLRNITQ